MGFITTIKSIRAFISFWYLQWELNSALYMMEPAEKVVIHTILALILGVIVYASLTYLPGHLVMMLHFLKIADE